MLSDEAREFLGGTVVFPPKLGDLLEAALDAPPLRLSVPSDEFVAQSLDEFAVSRERLGCPERFQGSGRLC